MRALLLVLLAASAFTGGCGTVWSDVPPPWTAATVADEPRVQATLIDGVTIVLENPTVTREDGFLLLYGDTTLGRLCVPLEHVHALRVERAEDFAASMFAHLVLEGIGGLAQSALRF